MQKEQQEKIEEVWSSFYLFVNDAKLIDEEHYYKMCMALVNNIKENYWSGEM